MAKDKPPLYMVRQGYNLIPEMSADAAMLEKLPENVRLRITATQPRSIPHHRRYWVMLQEVIDGCGLEYRAEDLHTLIKMKLGMFKAIRLRNGVVEYIPDSTSFEAMDQQEFNQFFDRAVKYLAEATGLDPLEIRKEAA